MLTESVGTEAQDEPDSQAQRQVDARGHEPVDDGQPRYLPADSYTEEGELRVYTQPLPPGAKPTSRLSRTRYAVHDVVKVHLVSCMAEWGGDKDYETHVAFVICQHDDATCDVRLADDLPTTVLCVDVQFTTVKVDADTRERLRGYDDDMHRATTLYTANGSRVSRHVSKHATSVARMNDGAAGGSARSHNDD